MTTTYKITTEMHLKKFIDETREVAQALNEFVDNLERIEKKYEEPQESEAKKCTYKETGCGSCKWQLDCPIDADGEESEDKE